MVRFALQPEHCIALASFEGGSSPVAFNAGFGLLYATAMLLSEMLAVRPCDIVAGERTRLEVRGSRKRTLPLAKGASDRLFSLLRTSGDRSPTEPIFTSPPLSLGRRQFEHELALRSRLLGFPRTLALLDFRIAFARHLADRQTPFEIIAAMIGYSDINTVQKLLMLAES
jgi:site-specific recombinase XerD